MIPRPPIYSVEIVPAANFLVNEFFLVAVHGWNVQVIQGIAISQPSCDAIPIVVEEFKSRLVCQLPLHKSINIFFFS